MTGKRFKAIILAVTFASFMIFFNAFAIAEANHDCAGEQCEICRVFEVVESAKKGLVCAAVGLPAVAGHGVRGRRTRLPAGGGGRAGVLRIGAGVGNARGADPAGARRDPARDRAQIQFREPRGGRGDAGRERGAGIGDPVLSAKPVLQGLPLPPRLPRPLR